MVQDFFFVRAGKETQCQACQPNAKLVNQGGNLCKPRFCLEKSQPQPTTPISRGCSTYPAFGYGGSPLEGPDHFLPSFQLAQVRSSAKSRPGFPRHVTRLLFVFPPKVTPAELDPGERHPDLKMPKHPAINLECARNVSDSSRNPQTKGTRLPCPAQTPSPVMRSDSFCFFGFLAIWREKLRSHSDREIGDPDAGSPEVRKWRCFPLKLKIRQVNPRFCGSFLTCVSNKWHRKSQSFSGWKCGQALNLTWADPVLRNTQGCVCVCVCVCVWG